MRKPFRLLFLLLGVLIFASPMVALADEITDDEFTPQSWQKKSLTTSAAKLRTSLANDPDTVWIGHIDTPGWIPKDRNGADVPNSARDANGAPTVAGTVPVGGYGAYHVGRGANLPGYGPGTHFNGVWDFDHFQAGDDTLQGWWPIARPYQSGDGTTPDDKKRPFFGLDYGNQGNYVLNQGSPKRTFGVTGYWHRDAGSGATAAYVDGTPTIPGPNVEWAPLGGTQSAWCGLRAHADLTHVDALALGGTGNPYNQNVIKYNGNNAYNQVGSVSPNATDKNFPGYGSQWDQMLYRDIPLGGTDALKLDFSYVHALSRVRGGSSTQKIGYFWKDPLKTVAVNDGNFISAADAEATVSGPVDSFTVYVGVPVDPVANTPPLFLPNDFVASTGSTLDIYDAKRRWFSEVVRTNGPLIKVLGGSGFSGDPATGLPPLTLASTTTIPNAGALAAIIAAGGGKVRVVFRVKTNRGSDDEAYSSSGFTSYTRGAAIIDNVVAQANGAGPNLVSNGDFESPSSINNDTGVSAQSAWKSTGKPPGVFVHVHSVDPLAVGGPAPWNDPCSPPVLSDISAPNRGCSMLGNVLTGGYHDVGEKPGGQFGGPDQDRARIAASPTIIMKTDGVAGSSNYNPMGLNYDLVSGATEYAWWFDIHTAGFRGNTTGNFRSIGMQSYPAVQANGATCWGEARFPLAITFNTTNTCGANFIALKSAGLIATSNSNGIPDSMCVQFQFLSRCYTFAAHTSSSCSPNSGTETGNHIDNLSLSIIKGVPPAGLSLFPWMWFTDAFPATSTTNFTSANFDTCSALVRSAINRSLLTGLTRPAVLGDSAQVTTGLVSGGVRVDMVFRILPGVGNYVQIGNRATALRKVPTSTTATTAAPAATSTNFWESYLADNGARGTSGGHPTVLGAKVWDPNVWNSARIDTMETNIFPAQSISGNLNALDNSNWQTNYHESDPKYAFLGIAKNRCFVVDASTGRGTNCVTKTPTGPLNCNVVCGITNPAAAGYDVFPPDAFASDILSGLAPVENGLPLGQTYEFTKIIPDGQLTPGAHVQYFFRREPGSGGALTDPFDVYPDTTQVFDGASNDGSRWFHFSVLPDRWKDPAFAAGGTGMACMLVVDVHDRQGDEFFWVSAADSIGLTSASKRGAHNGWYAAGGVNTPGTFDQATLRRDNGGQPGSRWDLWNVKAGESQTTGSAWLANRGAMQVPAAELMDGMEARTGPTGDMLRNFYRTMVYMTGGLTSQFFGTTPNRTDDDLLLMNDFAAISGGTAQPRGVYVIGQGFCEDLTLPSGNPPVGGVGFLNTYFGVNLKDKAYRTFSGNPKQVVQYNSFPGSAFDLAGASLGVGSGLKLGMSDGCGLENDVLSVYTPVTTAAAQTFYENVGNANDPHIASVYAPNTGATRLHITYLDGSRIQRIGTISTVLPEGREGFWYYMVKAISLAGGSIGCGPQASPVGVGDNPGSGPGSAFVNFMNLRSSNPMRSGEARIGFGVAKSEKVEVKVYDVTGRMVKTVANRVFAGGQEHVVTWDGTDEAGNRVKSGVYFYQLKTANWTSQKKLAVLSN